MHGISNFLKSSVDSIKSFGFADSIAVSCLYVDPGASLGLVLANPPRSYSLIRVLLHFQGILRPIGTTNGHPSLIWLLYICGLQRQTVRSTSLDYIA